MEGCFKRKQESHSNRSEMTKEIAVVEERFIDFLDIQGITHTVRITDIQAVGIGKPDGKVISYIRAHNCALTVPYNEAVLARSHWLRDG
jgi:hypothetical protein